MRNRGTVLVLAVTTAALSAAGCTGGRPWESRVPERDPLPEPPEQLMRKPPDFRLRDSENQREFLLFFYESADYREEVVLVTNLELPEAERRPRLATPDEHEQALRLFVEQWASRSDEEKLHYFNEIHLRELRRNATLLDQQIRFLEAAWRDLMNQKTFLEADLKSRRDTNVLAEGSEKFNLISSAALEGELARVDRRIAQTQAELAILRHLRASRDVEFGRQAAAVLVTTALGVDDLLPRYSDPQRLADQVRSHVRPTVWNRPLALIEIRGRHLVVRQTRDVIEEVERYLDVLREEFDSRR